MGNKFLIEVSRYDILDEMNLEDVGNFMEQNVTKHAIESRNWGDQFPYHPITVFAIAYSKKYIYVDFFVRGNFLRAVNYTDNSPVSEDSCVEFFMKKENDKEYWNFEFNCIGTINASHREERPNPTRLTPSQLAMVKRYASLGNRPFQEMEGLFSWELLVAIPHELVGINPDSVPVKLKGNFYKCASKTSMPHYLSWAPIHTDKPDFHTPQYFGEIILR